MKRLLHIIATPRVVDSRTLKVSEAFLESFRKKNPGCKIDTLDVSREKLPSLTVKRLDGKYALLGGRELSGETKEAWKEIVKYIEQFLSSDAYLVSTPMWNFSIPYTLKHYIDVILQPKYLFKYTEKGPEGLVKNKKMVVITSRGGDYGVESPFHAYDLKEPYLKTVFGFVGIEDIMFINTQPMDALGPEVQKEKIEESKLIAIKVAESI